LHLTPSAVSHQIRALEEELGVGLFLRESRGVKLAPAGTEYAERLHVLLDGVRTATDEVAARGCQQAKTGIGQNPPAPAVRSTGPDVREVVPAIQAKGPGDRCSGPAVAIRTEHAVPIQRKGTN